MGEPVETVDKNRSFVNTRDFSPWTTRYGGQEVVGKQTRRMPQIASVVSSLMMKFFSIISCLVILNFPAGLHSQVKAHELVVKKSEFRLNIMAGDSLVKSFSMALGKNTGDKQIRGDCRTPEGFFKIVQIQSSASWTHDFGDGKGETAGAYGPWFLRFGSGETRMKWTGIGIHGTHDPASIGTLASEGCIRLKNEDLEALRKLVEVGTKVTVLP